MKKSFLKTSALATLIPLASTFAQYNPDPDIFDAVVNGAGNGNSNDDINSAPSNESLGGTVQVVDLSQLPAIGQISGINLPIGQSGGMGSNGISIQTSGGMSGLPPIFSGGGGGGEGQQSPFPMPQGEGQAGSESGKMPAGQFPPPPPDIPIGEQGGLAGAESDADAAGETGEAGTQSEKKSKKNSNGSSSASDSQSESSGESDDQEMPENMGGGSGGSRGTGTEEGAQMPSGL